MNLKQLLTEDRAVSPVIGVILMVAITVILAAVIGTFVLGLGENMNAAPQASLGFDGGAGEVIISHEGGDKLSTDELVLVVNGTEQTSAVWGDDSWAAGEKVTFNGTNGGITASAENDVQIRHEPSGQIIGQSLVNVSAAP